MGTPIEGMENPQLPRLKEFDEFHYGMEPVTIQGTGFAPVRRGMDFFRHVHSDAFTDVQDRFIKARVDEWHNNFKDTEYFEQCWGPYFGSIAYMAGQHGLLANRSLRAGYGLAFTAGLQPRELDGDPFDIGPRTRQ